MFNVDMYTFKAKLKEENIFVWKEVDGSKSRIHQRDYIITMYVSFPAETKSYTVKGSWPFENVIRKIEEEHKLSHGFYDLSYKDTVGNVLIKTDIDWHNAIKFFKRISGYIMSLDLKKIPGVALSSAVDFQDVKELQNTMESSLFTKGGIPLLNNGSMTLEQAAAMFNVDMDTFKEKLKEKNILVWKEVDGTKTRIHRSA